MNRIDWLVRATQMFKHRFSDNGFLIPEGIYFTLKCPHSNVPVPISALSIFPSQVWPNPKMQSCSRYMDNFVEIFISPCINHSYDVLDRLVHELVHTAVGRETPHLLLGYLSGCHKDPFVYIANCVGLFRNGKHTHDLEHDLEHDFGIIIEEIGNYPGETE